MLCGFPRLLKQAHVATLNSLCSLTSTLLDAEKLPLLWVYIYSFIHHHLYLASFFHLNFCKNLLVSIQGWALTPESGNGNTIPKMPISQTNWNMLPHEILHALLGTHWPRINPLLVCWLTLPFSEAVKPEQTGIVSAYNLRTFSHKL